MIVTNELTVSFKAGLSNHNGPTVLPTSMFPVSSSGIFPVPIYISVTLTTCQHSKDMSTAEDLSTFQGPVKPPRTCQPSKYQSNLREPVKPPRTCQTPKALSNPQGPIKPPRTSQTSEDLSNPQGPVKPPRTVKPLRTSQTSEDLSTLRGPVNPPKTCKISKDLSTIRGPVKPPRTCQPTNNRTIGCINSQILLGLTNPPN